MNRRQNSLMRFSRTERLAQLSEQEIVIEKKKKEIQAKIEAQRKKETEEALKKLESSKESKNNKPGFSKKFSWCKEELKKKAEKEKAVEFEKKEGLTNAFSNDGSFLDQFKKLSQTGFGPDNTNIQTVAKEKNIEDVERDYKMSEMDDLSVRNEEDSKDEFRERNLDNQQSINSSLGRTFLDSNLQLQLPPPGVVQLVPQHQVQMLPIVQPIVQNTLPMVPPPVQMSNLQPLILNTVPKFTTNEIQLKALSSPSYEEKPQPVPPVHITSLQSPTEVSQSIQQAEFPNSRFNQQLLNIQPPLPMTPQNIPPPSPMQVQNIPPPPLPPRENNALPKNRTESISMTLKNNPVKKLELIRNPLEADENPSPPLVSETKFNFNGASKPRRTITEEDHSRISSALHGREDEQKEDDQGLEEKHRNLAQMVARYGDDFENSLRLRNEEDPDLRFLFEDTSRKYIMYRNLVNIYRKELNIGNEEKGEKIEKRSLHSDGDGDSSETKVPKLENKVYKQESSDSDGGIKDSSDKNHNGKGVPMATDSFDTKFNDGYQADNEDLPYYSMPGSTINDSFLPSLNTSGSNETAENKTKEKSEELKEERRKRKRKSRWGDVVATSSVSQPNVGPNLSLQSSGKLPAPKTNLLSQLTRSDPGLIQYAKQTFGSTNLSEEDWKKAEDHYKINLLYQDLVKKRAEIDKLERAGKFKYEYDSDEDVEGGTWEHKLRQQEMLATQLWAEELTRQAAGKHHIGDFLPPEELEKFMEKYNAVKEGREPDLSDYKEFKLKQDNVGYKLLQKMGWSEGQGLGQDGAGITNPVNKAITRHENQGLGVDRPDGLTPGDDEYDAYRKRMMLAYRFRPNPLNNPRRPYY